MENNEVFSALDDILAKVNTESVTAESAGYSDLPDGYYLCEVENAELKISKNGNAMASFRLKIVEDGKEVIFDDNGDVSFTELKKTANRKIFKNFLLKDESDVKRFVSDMLKFEDEDGNSYLPKEAFTTSELIDSAISNLIGLNIYVQQYTYEKKDGTGTQASTNFISWSKAAKLELPV